MTFKPWVAIAVGLVILACLAFVGIQRLELTAARAQLATLTLQLSLAKSANDSNVTVIKAQGAALDTWAGEAAKGAQAAKDAANALHVEQAARSKTAAALTALEAKDQALPECAKFLATDLAAVCPSHAQALKERSQ